MHIFSLNSLKSTYIDHLPALSMHDLCSLTSCYGVIRPARGHGPGPSSCLWPSIHPSVHPIFLSRGVRSQPLQGIKLFTYGYKAEAAIQAIVIARFDDDLC